MRNRNWISSICLTTLALVAMATAGPAQELGIYCIDVGQGDCTLISSPIGLTFLFDSGDDGQAPNVAAFLDSLGITQLHYFGASHYHCDHIGAIDELIVEEGVPVLLASYDRSWWYDSYCYDDYDDVLHDLRMEIQDGDMIYLGSGVTVNCVAVNGNGQLSPPFDDQYDENDLCIALVVSYGNFDFFVAGDLPGYNTSDYHDIETSVAPEVGKIEVYQVNHQGSRSSSNPYFLSRLRPAAAVISVGANPYGHPHAEAVDRIDNYAVIYQTEDGDGNIVDGDIAIITDGLSYTVNGDPYECDPPAVTITLDPDELPIVIPSEGGSFGYTVAVENGQSFVRKVDAWIDVTLPNGHHYGPIRGPQSVTIKGNQSKGMHLVEKVPGNAPPGEYHLNAYVGFYPDLVMCQDSFPFTKE